ncbi:MAG: hypothetical protein ABI365_07960 [Lysobacteraceae bacterium]
MTKLVRRLYLPLLTAALLAGCHDNPAPTPDKQPASPVGNTQLRDTIQKPINKAKSVEGTIEEAKEKQDKQLQDAGG